MKKIALTAALSVGMVGGAQAQDPAAALNALNGAVPNLTSTVQALVAGDAGATTQNLANTLNGLTTGLAGGTPLAGLATTGTSLTNTVVSVSASTTPLLTSLAAPVAEQGAPLASGVDTVSNIVNGFVPLEGAVPSLLGTAGVAGDPTFVTGITQQLVGQLSAGDLNVVSEVVGLVGVSELPGLGALPGTGGGAPGLDALPLDALDPAILTDLLSGGLPALPGAGGLPGLDALPLDALDPAILTDLLGGGLPALPGAGGLPGLDALPLDALDPAILTGLLGGGLPALPGAGGLPALPGAGGLPGLDALDPAVLTDLLGGLPGLDALPLDALDPAILTGLLEGGLPTLPATPAL